MLVSLYFYNLRELEYIDPDLVEELFSLSRLEEIAKVKIFLQNNQCFFKELGEDGTLLHPSFPQGGIKCNINKNGNGNNSHIPLPRDVKDEVHDAICHFLKVQDIDNFVITYETPELDGQE